MRRSVPLTLSALSLVSSTVLAPAAALAAAKHPATYKGVTYIAGPGWGDITVTIQVSGKKLTSITSTVTNDNNPSSLQRDDYALPVLKKEALKSASTKINSISGATQTSEAFIDSLKSALTKAHI